MKTVKIGLLEIFRYSSRYNNNIIVVVTYWLCPFSAARCMAVLSNAFFFCSLRSSLARRFQSSFTHSRWPFCAAMWRQVLKLVSTVSYSLRPSSLLLESMSYTYNAKCMVEIGILMAYDFAHLYYLWVIVLCGQKKSSFSALGFDSNSRVFRCLYKHSSLLQQKLKAFYLPILGSCQKRSVRMSVLHFFVSTPANLEEVKYIATNLYRIWMCTIHIHNHTSLEGVSSYQFFHIQLHSGGAFGCRYPSR